jgi:Flp pilus assembly protein TadD
VDAYQHAIKLSAIPARQGVFHGMKGHAYRRLGEPALAIDAYRHAAELDTAHAATYQKAAQELEAGP